MDIRNYVANLLTSLKSCQNSDKQFSDFEERMAQGLANIHQ
jgi:hypothetical protein